MASKSEFRMFIEKWKRDSQKIEEKRRKEEEERREESELREKKWKEEKDKWERDYEQQKRRREIEDKLWMEKEKLDKEKKEEELEKGLNDGILQFLQNGRSNDLYKMPNDINKLLEYFETVEQIFINHEIDKNLWLTLLIPSMSDKIKTYVLNLKQFSYSSVKRKIIELHRLKEFHETKHCEIVNEPVMEKLLDDGDWSIGNFVNVKDFNLVEIKATVVESPLELFDNVMIIEPEICDYYVVTTFVEHQENDDYALLKSDDEMGVALHEVGHALGLYHEHQRVDRNDHLDIAFEKVGQWAISNFKIPRSDSVMDYGVPYDVNSIMHYSGNIGASDPDIITIRTKDPLLQKNIGQRDSISFLDAKVVNLAYCKDKCSKGVGSIACQNGGYVDPSDCFRCLCPDGLSGKLCDQPSPSIGDKCSEEISLTKDSEAFISSPGYDEDKPYNSGIKCNYLVKCPSGVMSLNFVDKFSIYSSILTCQNWVEVRYKKDFSLPGPRFCGKSLPEFGVNSESNQVLVTFRSLTETSAAEDKAGFKLRIKCVA